MQVSGGNSIEYIYVYSMSDQSFEYMSSTSEGHGLRDFNVFVKSFLMCGDFHKEIPKNWNNKYMQTHWVPNIQPL